MTIKPKNQYEREALEDAQDLANVVLAQQSPPGTNIPEPEESPPEMNDYLDEEQNTNSVGPTPIVGEPAKLDR